MNLTVAVRKLERQAAQSEKIAARELAKAKALRDKLDSIRQLVASLGGMVAAKKTPKARRKRRGMSAAGRARIAAAQKKRWAAFHAKKGKTAPVKKAKRKLSPEGRARIIAAVKARWAKQKAAKK